MSSTHRVISVLPAGTAFSRYLIAKGIEAKHGAYHAMETARERWASTPQVLATLQGELEGKAAVAAGTTTDATWASPLAAYGIAHEALQLLRGASIIGALESRMRRVPFHVKVAKEGGSGAGGAWIGEGLTTPAAALSYSTLSQELYKAAKIVAFTDELRRIGDPDAERTIRDTTIAGVAAYLDSQFLTNTVTLSANLRPAAITNGATAVTSTGTTAAQMTADLNSLIAAITTTGVSLVWIMRNITAARICATLGASYTGLPASLFGIPTILSANSPQQVTLVDAGNILYSSDDNAFDVTMSNQATIEMADPTTDPPVAATVVQSLFQQNLWAVRVTRYLAYLRAQSGSVAYMTVTY